MKCLTCNECSDKEMCAKANGYEKAPFPLLSFEEKLCQKTKIFNYIKELTKRCKDQAEVLQHREHCIDWIVKNYPEVISKYLEVKYDL